MVQLVKTDSVHSIYFATPTDVDGAMCQFKFRSLSTNTAFSQNIPPRKEGDWFLGLATYDISAQPAGMYLLEIRKISGSVLVATRLAYLSPSASTPITTDYDTYNSATTNVVYNG